MPSPSQKTTPHFHCLCLSMRERLLAKLPSASRTNLQSAARTSPITPDSLTGCKVPAVSDPASLEEPSPCVPVPFPSCLGLPRSQEHLHHLWQISWRSRKSRLGKLLASSTVSGASRRNTLQAAPSSTDWILAAPESTQQFAGRKAPAVSDPASLQKPPPSSGASSTTAWIPHPCIQKLVCALLWIVGGLRNSTCWIQEPH